MFPEALLGFAAVLGAVLLIAVAWVWIKKQVFGVGGAFLTFAGVLLMGLMVLGTLEMTIAGNHFKAVLLEVYKTRGAVLQEGGSAEEARVVLQKAVELDPEDPEAWAGLGEAQMRLGEWDTAEASFLRVGNLQPENLENQLRLANVLDRQGKLDRAVEVANSVVETAPTNLRAKKELGILLARRGDGEAANRLISEALRENPGSSELLQGLGRIQLEQEDYDSAVATLSEAVRTDPSPDLYRDLGTAFERAGREDEASAAYDAAIAYRGQEMPM